MSLFAIIGHDVADSSAQRQITRAEHVERLQALGREQRLILAGPTPIEHGKSEMSGSLIIADFESLDAAKNGQALSLTCVMVSTVMSMSNRLFKPCQHPMIRLTVHHQ